MGIYNIIISSDFDLTREDFMTAMARLLKQGREGRLEINIEALKTFEINDEVKPTK